MPLTKQQLPLILIALLGLGPIPIAWLMATQGWALPERTSNLGELIEPGDNIDQWALLNPDGSPWHPQRRWQLLLISDGFCDALCHHWIDTLDAIQRRIGRDRDRVAYRLIGNPDTSQPNAIISSHPDQLPEPARIYLADPLGNVVLSYRFDASPKAILKDLKRLLRASQIG